MLKCSIGELVVLGGECGGVFGFLGLVLGVCW